MVEVAWQQDFLPPVLASAPSYLGQEVASRGKDIRIAAPDIPPPVSIGIHGIGDKGRGHELQMPHRTGPGTFHAASFYVTCFQNSKGSEQLLAEEVAAPGIKSQGRQGADDRKTSEGIAVVRFQTPEGHEIRSEERRVGNECRSSAAQEPDHS